MTATSSPHIPRHWNYWGLAAEPFHPVLRWPEDQRFVYHSASRLEALARLQYVADYQFGLAVVTGETGSGKSLLLTEAVSSLSQQGFRPLLHVCQSSDNNREHPFGVAQNWETSQILAGHTQRAGLNYLPGSRYVLLLDDASRIGSRKEVLKALIDQALQQRALGCLVVAITPRDVPELYELLMSYAPLLVPCSGCSVQETAKYLQYRFEQAGGTATPFSEAAASQLHQYTAGIPRRLNRLAHECLLLAAYRQLSEIPVSMIQEIQQQLSGAVGPAGDPSSLRAA